MRKSNDLRRAAVLTVGYGRGFIVRYREARYGNGCVVVTAAHCLPKPLPPSHPHRSAWEATYPNLLGSLHTVKPNVCAECLFVDPMADIAVLGRPDGQVLPDEAEDAYDVLMDKWPAFTIGGPPQINEKCRYFVLALDGKWVQVHVRRPGRYFLGVEPTSTVKSGMSGSPIVDKDGTARTYLRR